MQKYESKVYILQKPIRDMDFSSADRYGKIIYIFEGSDNPSLAPTKSKFHIMKMLREFDADRDYIINCGGDPVVGILAGICFSSMGIERVQYLRWDKEKDLDGNRTGSGFYTPVNIKLQRI